MGCSEGQGESSQCDHAVGRFGCSLLSASMRIHHSTRDSARDCMCHNAPNFVNVPGKRWAVLSTQMCAPALVETNSSLATKQLIFNPCVALLLAFFVSSFHQSSKLNITDTSEFPSLGGDAAVASAVQLEQAQNPWNKTLEENAELIHVRPCCEKLVLSVCVFFRLLCPSPHVHDSCRPFHACHL